MAERCRSFRAAFPDRPASWPTLGREGGRDVIYAHWVIGNDYRNRADFYGAYPNGYMERLFALFPDIVALAAFEGQPPVLHAYSGSLPADPRWTRVDVREECQPDICGSVYDIGKLTARRYRLICADPPYTLLDAKKYGTNPVNRLGATSALAEVVAPGGYLAWLDTSWPQHRKTQWVTVGRITVIRSTNHRVRLLSLFQAVRM